MRSSSRAPNELRPFRLTRRYTKHAEGSVLVECGDTRVVCTATVAQGVPRFLKGENQGWLTAEYGMLPRSTHSRTQREASYGKQVGRTLEIQRLIGRSLRSAVNLKAMGEYTITLDCDVLQADGGTRTAAITGSCVALYDALEYMKQNNLLKRPAFRQWIAAVSVGMHQNTPILDLDYHEDSNAQTDMNVVMNEHGGFIEVQGTAENDTFSQEQLLAMLTLAKQGARQLFAIQRAVLGLG